MLPPLRPSNVRPKPSIKQGGSASAIKRDEGGTKVPSVRPARIGIKACAIRLRSGLTVLDRNKG